jgi:hypothetical protein
MTEAEWLNAADSKVMLDFLRGRGGDRKLRLFACAGVERMHRLCWPEADRSSVVEVAEQYADGMIEIETLREVRAKLGARGGISSRWAVNCGEFAVLDDDADAAARKTVDAGRWFYCLLADEQNYFNRGIYDVKQPTPEGIIAREAGNKWHADLLRDAFANPFGPVDLDPSWLTPPAVALAQSIYDHRAFERMPELAGILEQAGCNINRILAHCRDAGPHARGCWVLDLLLRKQ